MPVAIGGIVMSEYRLAIHTRTLEAQYYDWAGKSKRDLAVRMSPISPDLYSHQSITPRLTINFDLPHNISGLLRSTFLRGPHPIHWGYPNPKMSERAGKKPPSTRRGIPHKRPRKRLGCEPCRSAKLRCDCQQPCASCRRRECESACTFRESRGPVTADVQPVVASRAVDARDTILEEPTGASIPAQAPLVPAYLSQTAAPSTVTPPQPLR